MTINHSPLIRLQKARRDLDAASERCPHWDYESNNFLGNDCCHDLLNARLEHHNALKAWKQYEEGVKHV